MPRSIPARFLLGLLPAWLFAAAIGTAAPNNKGEGKSAKPNGTVEQIRKALDKTVTLEIETQPLQNALSEIGEAHKFNIVLDRSVALNMGLELTELTVEFKAKDVKLRNALRNLLNQHNLSFGIVGDSLLVSTEENIIYRQLKHRISVDLDNVPLNKAMRELSQSHGVNVVVDPRTFKTKLAESPVTLQVDDVPFETAVRLMAEIAGLRPVRMGNVLFVTSEERAEKLKDSDNLVPSPGLSIHGPGMIVPGLPGGVAPGGIVPLPAPGAEKEKEDPKEKVEPKKEEPKEKDR